MTLLAGMDERLHATVLKAALDAQLAPDVRTYEYGEVPGGDDNPGDVPDIYVLLTVERRHAEATHLPARITRTGWRVTARPVATTANEARWATLRITQALDGVRLTVDGVESTPVTQESSNPPELLDGRFEALSRWTYAL